MIWVVDSSVAINWFLAEEAHPQADRVLEAVIDQPETFAVPELFAFEVYAVLQRLHPQGLQAFRDGVIPLLQSGIFRRPISESGRPGGSLCTFGIDRVRRLLRRPGCR